MNVMLTPNHRQAKRDLSVVEWFDVVDARTNELLPWTVSRNGDDVAVNGPQGFVRVVGTLEAAVGVIREQPAA
ncbi:hypothetical protein ABT093_19600 [Kitasatospora sp. NPDC002551]|uniref:hypothetical protein n=1 Tax=Kitasatospora sp. NPDC002551 TaxID=3154539 RepID=UPI00331B9E1D